MIEMTFDELQRDHLARHREDLYEIKVAPLTEAQMQWRRDAIAAADRFIQRPDVPGIPEELRGLINALKNEFPGADGSSRSFNFWHWLLEKAPPFDGWEETTDQRQVKLRLTMDLVGEDKPMGEFHMLFYPYIAKGDQFARPVLERILSDHGPIDLMLVVSR